MASFGAAHSTPAVRLAAFPRQVPTWLILVLVGGLALLPRVLGLADFYTVDEAYHWPQRTRAFAEAIAAHSWAATNQTGHPGVTTMWLGSLGYWLANQIGIYLPGRTGGGASYLALLRLPLAIANSIAIVIGYALLRRLLAPATALLAALLWATAPFLVAHSRVLHLDALLTSFMTLSVLCMLVATVGKPAGGKPGAAPMRLAYIASAMCGGLALLTKAPGLILLPSIGLMLFALSPRAGLWPRVRWSFGWYMPWLALAVAVVFAGWPAMWVAPRQAIGSVVAEIVDNGGQPHVWGNFFMGQPVEAPGWGFYPAIVAWRMTPLALLGLALAPLAIWLRRRERRALLALLGFALLFMLVMGREPKAFDRYLLPIWPALLTLAAAGLAAPFQLLARRVPALRPAPLVGALGALALTGALLAEVLAYHPYTLAYFNPLLGGGAAAAKSVLVGWGEGSEQAGAWLRGRPDLAQGSVVSRNPPTLEPFLPVRVRDLTMNNVHDNANYVVLYISYVQRQNDRDIEAYVRQTAPLHTVVINNIPYAEIFQLPRPFDRPIDAAFAGGLRLRGTSQKIANGALAITPSWDVQRDQPGSSFVFIHLLDAAGQRVAQLDLPLDSRFAQWQAGQQLASPFSLPLPANLPAGSYRAVLGVYDPASGQRRAIISGPALPESLDGPGTVEVAAFEWPAR